MLDERVEQEPKLTDLFHSDGSRTGPVGDFLAEIEVSDEDHYLLEDWIPAVSNIQQSIYGQIVDILLKSDTPKILLQSANPVPLAAAVLDLVELSIRSLEIFNDASDFKGLTLFVPDDAQEHIVSKYLDSFFQFGWSVSRFGAGDNADADIAVLVSSKRETIEAETVDLLSSNLIDSAQIFWIDGNTLTTATKQSSDLVQAAPTFRDKLEITREQTEYFLKRFWGFDGFRDGQWEITSRILQGKSTIGILPTGAGKTVCFQLPALLKPGLTIVISPLQSLMLDQVINLERSGLDLAGYIASDQSEQERNYSLERLRNADLKLFYLSPERLQNQRFVDDLQTQISTANLQISQFVIDEAHCMSDWGHDFRPSYLNLPHVLKRIAPEATVTGLTATASKNIQKDMLQILELDGDEDLVVPGGLDRPEISIEVFRSEASHTKRLEAVDDFISKRLPARFKEMNIDQVVQRSQDSQRYEAAGLVFVPWRKQKEITYRYGRKVDINAYDLAKHIEQDLHIPAAYYYSSDSSKDNQLFQAQKRTTQTRFKKDLLPIVVATKGFGTGIDKPNIRFVLHTCYSQALEGYYQEVGRAGRDRKDSHAALLYVPRHEKCSESSRRDGLVPPCTKPGVFDCPVGLAGLCSYGIQARFIRLSFPGTKRELDDHWRLLSKIPLNVIEEGGEATFKRFFPASKEDGLDDERKAMFEKLLVELRNSGLVDHFQVNETKKLFFVEASPVLHDAGRKDTIFMFVTEFLKNKNNWTAMKAEKHAFLCERFLKRPPRSGRYNAVSWKSPPAPAATVEVEKMLYRLVELNILDSYEAVGSNWVAHFPKFSVDRIRLGLVKALSKFKDPEATAMHLQQFEKVGYTEKVHYVYGALHVFTEAYYDIYENRKWQMLVNMDRFCTTSGCRKQQIENYLMGFDLPDSYRCGRCDNCQIEDLEAVLERLESETRQGISREENGVFSRATSVLPDFQAIDSAYQWAVSNEAVDRFTDKSRRIVEDNPDTIGAHLLVSMLSEGRGDPQLAKLSLSECIRICIEQDNPLRLGKILSRVPSTALEMRTSLTGPDYDSQFILRAAEHSQVSELFAYCAAKLIRVGLNSWIQ